MFRPEQPCGDVFVSNRRTGAAQVSPSSEKDLKQNKENGAAGLCFKTDVAAFSFTHKYCYLPP